MFGARQAVLVVGTLCGATALGVADDTAAPAAAGEHGEVPLTVRPEPPPDGSWRSTATRAGNPVHGWAAIDYTVGWVRGATAPPLLTAATGPGGPTTVLFPTDALNGDARSGFRLRGGLWLDECATCGIEAGMLVLCEAADRARAGDTPGVTVGRPFFNVQSGAPDFQLVSRPGAVSGRAAVDAESSHFCAFDLAFRQAICQDCRGRLDWLVGYRCLSYDDSVRVLEDLRPAVAPFPPGSRIGVADEFLAGNHFHGLLVGLGGEYRLDHCYAEVRAGVSFGRTYRTATVAGATTFDVPPTPPMTLPGGLLALTSNAGRFSGSDWVCVPEASVRVGYRATESCRVYVGYSCLYWPKVYRAADQIDPAVNPDLLPPPILPPTGPIRPLFPDRQSALWVHAVSIGVEWRY